MLVWAVLSMAEHCICRNNSLCLLDRDGTIIAERSYLSDPDQVELLPGTVEGLRRLQRMGCGLVVITNQSGIGRGYFTETQLARIHERMKALLAREQVRLDGIYICPHRPEEHCSCRKPEPGLVFAARSIWILSRQRCTCDCVQAF